MILKLTGQWPYQSMRTRSIIYGGVLFLCASHTVPQVMAAVKHLHDWDVLIDCVTPLIFMVFCLVKYFCSVINSNKVSYVYL